MLDNGPVCASVSPMDAIIYIIGFTVTVVVIYACEAIYQKVKR